MSVYAEEASKKVIAAENEILKAIKKKPSGYTPDELVSSIAKKSRNVSDDEVRDAIWRLLASGDLELSDDLKLTPPDYE